MIIKDKIDEAEQKTKMDCEKGWGWIVEGNQRKWLGVIMMARLEEDLSLRLSEDSVLRSNRLRRRLRWRSSHSVLFRMGWGESHARRRRGARSLVSAISCGSNNGGLFLISGREARAQSARLSDKCLSVKMVDTYTASCVR